MVRYYGRAKSQVGMNTNQPGIKMSGCPSKVGLSGQNNRYIQQRVSCMRGVCGIPLVNGVIWRYSLRNEQPFCKEAATKCSQAAGGVGTNKNIPYYRCGKGGFPSCLEQIYGKGWQRVQLDSLNFLYLSPNCYPLLTHFERKSGRKLEAKKGNETPFPPSFPFITLVEFTNPSIYIIPVLWQPWYPLFYPVRKACAINKYGSRTWNQLFVDNPEGCPRNRFGMVEVANHGGKDGCYCGEGFWWFYHAPGSGIFIDLGQSLICMNKADALHRYKQQSGGANIVAANTGSACGTAGTAAPGGTPGDLATYLDQVIAYLETLPGPGTAFRFGKMLSLPLWNNVKTYVVNTYGGPNAGTGFANLFTSNSGAPYFTNASPAGTVAGASAERDILAHGVLGTTLSSPQVDIDCRLQSILINSHFNSIQMLCQPNYQGGWTTEILYYGNPTFYDAHRQKCDIKTAKPDCLCCASVVPSIDVKCC